MKNKVRLKNYLKITIILSIILLILFLIISTHEYNTYTNNFNVKIDSIIAKLKEEYPDISDKDIMNIINSNEISSNSTLEQYGINLKKEAVLLENNQSFQKFLVINSIFFIFVIALLVYIFLMYDRRTDKELSEITKYIEEINKRNYTLKIDEISEDELSILRNEIYKTTVMLKENADNSLKDKLELKKSLEDISHQLKTPLTSILIILDNIIDDPYMDKDTREDFIRDIKREMSNINFLVQSILKLSKLDTNTVNFIENNRSLTDLVNESIKNVSTLCDLRNIKIETHFCDTSQIRCDFKWQVEAITNILKNCIEHSKNSSLIILKTQTNNIYSSLTIKDFGTGIDKKDLPHIFERFYKGKNSGKDSVGIGLSLAKTIIEKDNGTVSVDSDNTGTTFVIKYFLPY